MQNPVEVGQRADMAEIHQFIIRRGIEEARRQAVTKHERLVIEAAYQVLSDDAEKMGFTYSGFALTSLPHKPQTELMWKRDGHNLTMLMQSGVDRTGAPLGLPYGSYARFILLFLQSEAIRTGSREVELGRSMRVWLSSMGLSIGGKTYKKVNEQARRISGCSLTFFADRQGAQIKSRGGFVKTEITMANTIDDDQPMLWQDRVLLDEDFYRALREHPVPVSESCTSRYRCPFSGYRHLYMACLPSSLLEKGCRGELACAPYAVRGRGHTAEVLPRIFQAQPGHRLCRLSGSQHRPVRPRDRAAPVQAASRQDRLTAGKVQNLDSAA